MDISSEVRSSAVAGTFYPASPEVLRREIESCLEKVVVDRSDKDIVALIAPHAGYKYSGPVAAYSYRQVVGKPYQTVVVIAPSHSVPFYFSSVFSGAAYKTPLGEVLVDREIVEALNSHPVDSVCAGEIGHLHSSEHSLEVQLPFLQVVLDEFKVVPVIMGSQSRENCVGLAEALGSVLKGKQVLIVASSDLSHFHNQSVSRELDEEVIAGINCFDPDRLLRDVADRKAEACGVGPMAAAMAAARLLGAQTGENLFYSTSGDITGDYSQVVGYTAGIFYR